MNPTVAALVPVFALIALGFLLKAAVFQSDHFWEPVEKLTYYILFPALLVLSMAQARVSGPVVVPLIAVLATIMAGLSAFLAIVVRPLLRIDGPTLSAVVQGSVRFNTYVGLAAAAALFGRPGTALLAIVLAVLIPLSNVLSVIALTRHGAGGAPSWGGTIRELVTNPLIIASAIGLALSVTDTPLPSFAVPVLDSLGRASLALGLLAVGAGLRLGSLASGSAALAVSTLLKLVVSPALAWLGCRALDLDPLATAIAVLFAALPPAPSAYILTRRLGGDHALMANIITVHTVAAAITLPVILSLPG
jgi:malonate transporter